MKVEIAEIDNYKNRINWIDTAKLIGIYLVIFGHIEWLLLQKDPELFFVKWLYSFHMPLFFFLSGLTSRRKKFSDTLKKSFRQLIVPYFCFSFILYVWYLFWQVHSRNISISECVIKPILGIFFGLGFDTSHSVSICGGLWFCVALFWCKLLNSAVEKLSCNLLWEAIVCILCLVFSLLLDKYDAYILFSIGSAIMAYPIFYIGYFLGNNIKTNKIIVNDFSLKVWQKVLFIVLAVILLCIVVGGGTNEW